MTPDDFERYALRTIGRRVRVNTAVPEGLTTEELKALGFTQAALYRERYGTRVPMLDDVLPRSRGRH